MPARQSFIGQLTRRLAREELSLTVDYYAPMSLAAMTGLLPRLPLQQYDLIVLQPGQIELQRPASLRTLLATKPAYVTPADWSISAGGPGRHNRNLIRVCRDGCARTGLQLMASLTGLPRLQRMRHELRTLLDGLQPCGHNVVLVTPLPHPDLIGNWLRRQGRRVFLEEGYRAFMPVFDAYALLNVGDVCFSAADPSRLNALGHELLGSALYDFFRAGVMGVGDSSTYRRHE